MDNKYSKKKQSEKVDLYPTIIIGLLCNENCYFCNTDENVENLCITIEDIDKKLDEYRRKGISRIQFSGGEPTINSIFFKALELARRKGFNELSIQTNATTSSYPDFAVRLKKDGINYAFVSLHSHSPKIHDQITRLEGSFELTTKGIKNMISAGIAIDISFVINVLNYPYLKDFVLFAKESLPGVSRITFSYVSPNAHAWKNKWIVPKMSEVSSYIIDALECGKEKGMTLRISDYCGLPMCFIKGYEMYSDTYYYANNPIGKITMRTDRIKPDSCKQCRWYGRCTGVWKNYAAIYGTQEIHPFL